jgi:hypothetical protein
MHLSVSSVLVALALSAATSPIESVEGTQIPIAKQFSLTKPDGSVDLELLRSSRRSSMKCVSDYFVVLDY